jgi:hypothetical protein
MVDGFWILQIPRPDGASGGVVVFVNGKMFGGDSGFSWVGTYEQYDGIVKGRVTVHNFDPQFQSLLGIQGDYELHFSAVLEDGVITGTALVANQPQKSLGIRLIKRANL